MKDKRTTINICIFDASAFLTLGLTGENVITLPEKIWMHLEGKLKSQKMLSHIVVYNEIVSQSAKDFISTWMKPLRTFFEPRTDEQKALIPKIIHKFPKLIDPNQEKEQADPWLIALAIERSKKQNLFEVTNTTIVTQENPRSTEKIPAACRHFGIGHFSLKQYFDYEGIKTTANI